MIAAPECAPSAPWVIFVENYRGTSPALYCLICRCALVLGTLGLFTWCDFHRTESAISITRDGNCTRCNQVGRWDQCYFWTPTQKRKKVGRRSIEIALESYFVVCYMLWWWGLGNCVIQLIQKTATYCWALWVAVLGMYHQHRDTRIGQIKASTSDSILLFLCLFTHYVAN